MCGQTHELGSVEQQFLRGHSVVRFQPIAKPIVQRFEHGKRLHVGHVLQGITPAWHERYGNMEARCFHGLLDPHIAGQHDHIGHAGTRGLSNGFVNRQDLGQASRLIAHPIALRG